MELEFSEKIIEQFLPGSEIEKNNSYWIIKKTISGKLLQIKIDKSKINELIKQLKSFNFRESILYDSNSFEIPITKRTTIVNSNIKIDNFEFYVSPPSDLYLLHLFLTSSVSTLYYLSIYSIFERVHESDLIDLWDFLRVFSDDILKFETLIIKADSHISFDELNALIDSYLFYFAYSSHTTFKRKKPLEMRWQGVYLSHAFNPSEIPKKNVRSELLTFYLQGTDSRDPFVTYIAYYHIIEYFFKIVQNEFKQSFDFSQLDFFEGSANELKKIFFNLDMNEQKELELVLRRFINKNELINELNSYEKSYYDYLLNNKIGFSGAKELNDSKFYSSLANRIYKTRNSLVHRKENYKEKYLPSDQNHVEKLQQELLLIRIIASQIINKDSENRI